MFATLLLTMVLLAAAVILLSVRLFFGRRFVNRHVDSSPALQRRGIHCARQQDQEQRTPKACTVNEHAPKEHNSYRPLNQ